MSSMYRKLSSASNLELPAYSDTSALPFVEPEVSVDEAKGPLITPGTVIRLQSAFSTNKFLRHRGFMFHVDAEDGTGLFRVDSEFIVMRALEGDGVTLRSVNYPDRNIRHQGYVLKLHDYENKPLFHADASWTVKELMLQNKQRVVALYSANYATHCMTKVRGGVKIVVPPRDRVPEEAMWIVHKVRHATTSELAAK